MKIALVAPYSLFYPPSRMSDDDRINQYVKAKQTLFKAYAPCDSLLQLAALTPLKHELIYMDDQYGNVNSAENVDLAALSFMTVSADRAYEIADGFRRRGVHVVMGGVHPTFCPEDAAKHADTVVIGDADGVWKRFLLDFENKTPKAVYNGGCADLTKRPPPRFDIIPRKWFFRNAMQREMYSIHTTLGCTRACKFCSNWKKAGYNRLQKKTLRQIRRELERIASYSDNFYLSIMDDNLFMDVAHGRKVMEVIKEMNINWFAPTDISIAHDPSLLKLIRESGCKMLVFGLESLREENLKWLAPWKARQVVNYKDAIKKLRDAGINALGSFMVGLEYDTKAVFDEIFDFFIDTKLAGVGVGILTPYPGTDLRDRLIKENRLDLDAPWGSYTCYNLLFKHPILSKKDICDGLFGFYQKCETPEVAKHLKKVSF